MIVRSVSEITRERTSKMIGIVGNRIGNGPMDTITDMDMDMGTMAEVPLLEA